ncbi:MAG: TlpA disulfide reductase family protein [Pirellulales bacterium]|nr:TlpA disulfide reductase family protein [Pirellulales bacterium]
MIPTLTRRFSFWGLLLIVCHGCGGSMSAPNAPGKNATTDPTPVVSAQPQVKLETVSFDRLQTELAGMRGKVVVLDCWATYCTPCIQEFPHLVELSESRPADKLQCVSLSFDYQGVDELSELQPKVLEFLQAQKASRVRNFLSSDEDGVLYEKFGFGAIPVVRVYDQTGALVKQFSNSGKEKFTYADVTALVNKLLAE